MQATRCTYASCGSECVKQQERNNFCRVQNPAQDIFFLIYSTHLMSRWLNNMNVAIKKEQ